MKQHHELRPRSGAARHAPRSRSAIAFGFLALAACSGGSDDDGGPAPATSALTSTYDSTVAIQWNETLYGRIRDTGVNPPRAARIWGYTGVALYEAVVPGMPDHQSLGDQLQGLTPAMLPDPAPGAHDWAIAANRALAVVANALVANSTAQFDAQEAALHATLSAGVATAIVDRSVAYGDALGDAIVAWAATDGTADQAACQTGWVPPIPPASGGWIPVTGSAQPLLPCWGAMRPFVVTDGEECEPVGAPAFSTSTSSAFYAQGLLVNNTTGDDGANLTTDQRDIALYWSDGATATGTPPGHWIAITCQLCEPTELDLSLDVAAEAFARVGMAVHDAFITCWQEKYSSYLQRPATYITATAAIDPAWTAVLATPNFPAYPSGHSTQSGAAATVLTHMFGAHEFTDTCHSRLNTGTPGLPADRTFTSFSQAASEAAISRLYGGIHYLFDNYDGIDSGVCVGTVHNSTLHFLADN